MPGESIVESAVQWAIGIAEDDSHGYSQASDVRWGNPDYDCSSLVISAYDQAFKLAGQTSTPKTNGASYTGDMKAAFLASGFTDVTSTVNQTTGDGLVRGDVLLNIAHHTAMYIGEYKGVSNLIVQASSSETGGKYGSPGDQTGGEIKIKAYSRYSNGGWDVVLRLSDGDFTHITNPSLILHPEVMTPYIGVVGETDTNVDYRILKSSKVSGMMFCGGAYFDITHSRRSNYFNPYLGKLVKDCEAANLPYALFWCVRSRNHIEADAEAKALYYVVSKYPPKLGIWLKVSTGNTVAINDDILSLYLRKIESWGLGSKCGLYVTPTQLASLSWSKFEDKFYLWMIDYDIDLSTIDNQILQPEMFEVPD